MRHIASIAVIAAFAMLSSASGGHAAALKAAAFDIEPVELPQTADSLAKFAKESDLLRKTLADKGLFVVDLAPQQKKIAQNLPLSQCNGCDQDIAQALGADIEVATAIQKVGSSVYNISGTIKDVATNRVLRAGVVSINGDGEDEWNHGVRFLVKERLLTPPLPADAADLKAMVAKAPKPAE